jgi:hypothetical protein
MSGNQIAGAENTSSYRFWYSMQESEQESNSLLIEDDGTISANIEVSAADYALRGLGSYQIKSVPSDADVRRIGALIVQGHLIGGEVYAAPPSFGALSVYFQFQANGEETLHGLDALAPLPEPFREIETIVERLYVRLAAGPLRTMSMNVAIEPVSVAAGKDTRILLEFCNHGRSTVEFRNPVHVGGPSSGSLRANLWRAAPGSAADAAPELESTIELSGRELLTAPRQAVSSRQATLTLGPGKSLKTWTTIKFPRLAPGPYRMEVVYYGSPKAGAELSGGNLVVGEYHSDLFPFAVVR